MSRNKQLEFSLDPEIEKTLKKQKRARKKAHKAKTTFQEKRSEMADNNESRAENQGSIGGFVSFNPRNMIRIRRPFGSQRLVEMKTGLVQLMYANPFAGLDHEDSYNHLTKFFELVGTAGISKSEEETIFLRLFPLTLIGKAKEWFLDLPQHMQSNWNMVEEKFMSRYFPQGKFMDLKTTISTFIQPFGESLCEAWDRFKSMLTKCPNHGFDVQTEIHIFINGLQQQHKWIVNATAGGQLMTKPPQEAINIIESMALNDQKSQHQRWPPPRQGGMLELNPTDKQIFRCDNCNEDNDANVCQNEEVNVVGNPPRQNFEGNYPQGGNNQFQKNQPWRQDPPQRQNFYPQNNQYQHPTQDKSIKLENTLNQFMQMTMANQKNTNASLRNIEIQIGQLAKQIAENEKSTFSANTEINPREHSHAILRSESGPSGQ
ncbi:PREDICTED: uncharacterized protein LOC109330831 [Lupinus angustifolius]|uniref:uncharacterized protein LOC109330831 n=1 Tax=Lupinus angustifolius TaxID=3871 RepID=UPI00092F5A68|nr:PREDICTED: uncharacterized protein LOC109330831 [Lupinus angustifolius]